MILFTKFLKFPILPIVPISMNPVRSALTFAQLYAVLLYLRHYKVATADEDGVVGRGEALGMKHCLTHGWYALIVKT